MKNISRTLISFFMLLGLAALTEAQSNPNARGNEVSSVPNNQYDNHQRRMSSLKTALKNAKTDEQRKEIYSQIQQEIEQYQSATSPTELTPATLAARKQKIEEKLKKNPLQKLYQLLHSIANPKEQVSYNAKAPELIAKHVAERETKLTLGQRVAIQTIGVMQAELKPLIEQLHTAKTDEERKAVHLRMREVIKNRH